MELSDREKQQLLQNSVERMINTSTRLADYVADHAKEEHYLELASTSQQDWNELKWLVCKLWSTAQEQVPESFTLTRWQAVFVHRLISAALANEQFLAEFKQTDGALAIETLRDLSEDLKKAFGWED